jgi:hypothetical protein
VRARPDTQMTARACCADAMLRFGTRAGLSPLRLRKRRAAAPRNTRLHVAAARTRRTRTSLPSRAGRWRPSCLAKRPGLETSAPRELRWTTGPT